MADKLSPLLDQLAAVLAVGGKGLQGAAVGGLRLLLPLIEVYTGRRVDEGQGGGEAGRLGLDRGEELLLKAAVQKGFLELVEITSRTHRVYPDAPLFSAFDAQGVAQTPQLVHLLALAAAARQTFGDGKDEGEGQGDEGGEPDPSELPPPGETVVFMAVGPGEYAQRSGPMTAREIRRMSMRQRNYTPPQAARLKSAPHARQLQVGPALQVAVAARSAPKAAGALALRSGCGCGGSGGCARCGGGVRSFGPEFYDKDGKCQPLGTVSCDTRWRVRECLKVAFCDLLRNVGDQLCDENGGFDTTANPDWKALLGSFACSVLNCLPDAICPPPESPACAAPLPCIEASDDCNFAVGE
jgi:hypothetical protein